MKFFYKLYFVLSISLLLCGYYYPNILTNKNPNNILLYQHQTDGLPIVNHHKANPGCYLVCYNKDPSIYKAGNFGLHGLIRIEGSYPTTEISQQKEKRSCHPKKAKGLPPTQIPELIKLCNENFPTCKNSCLPGSDTGSFYFK